MLAAAVSLVVSSAALLTPARVAPRSRPAQMVASLVGGNRRLLVLGGSGYAGSNICKNAVEQGWTVTSLSRRGENPDPKDDRLCQVDWRAGDATDKATIESLTSQADAVVHAIGLLFDVNSGLANFNVIVSGSNSKPDESSTYDNITRKTASLAIEAAEGRAAITSLFGQPMPFVFISAAEAGWPDVQFGPQVDAAAPEWLQRYLKAKRTVESKLSGSARLREVVLRPSLMWSWDKLDVLPAIPIFNIANALGVPFVDKTVRVETLAKAAVAALDDSTVSGVQRFDKMEQLAESLAPGKVAA